MERHGTGVAIQHQCPLPLIEWDDLSLWLQRPNYFIQTWGPTYSWGFIYGCREGDESPRTVLLSFCWWVGRQIRQWLRRNARNINKDCLLAVIVLRQGLFRSFLGLMEMNGWEELRRLYWKYILNAFLIIHVALQRAMANYGNLY